MIEHGQVYHFAGPGELARSAVIGVAWPGIAARVVMGDNYPGAAKPQRVGNNLADRQSDLS